MLIRHFVLLLFLCQWSLTCRTQWFASRTAKLPPLCNLFETKPTLHFIVTAINHAYYHCVQSVHGIWKSQLCSMYIPWYYDCNLRHHVPTVHIVKLAITFSNLSHEILHALQILTEIQGLQLKSESFYTWQNRCQNEAISNACPEQWPWKLFAVESEGIENYTIKPIHKEET